MGQEQEAWKWLAEYHTWAGVGYYDDPTTAPASARYSWMERAELLVLLREAESRVGRKEDGEKKSE
jgi:hypothetical protein